MADRVLGIIGAVLWGILWTACILAALVFLPLDLLDRDR